MSGTEPRVLVVGAGLDVDIVFGEATSLASGTEGFAVTTDVGETLRADLVIIATGSTPRSLGVPGEAEFEHRGVSLGWGAAPLAYA